jgi:bacillaene biosynthesis, polyketide synthase / nonribosomal peptide synthetase PksN/BaeN
MPNGQTVFGEILPSLLAALTRHLTDYCRVQSLDAGGDLLLAELQAKLASSAADTTFRLSSQSSNTDRSDDQVFYISARDDASSQPAWDKLRKHRNARLFVAAPRQVDRQGASNTLLELASLGWLPLGTERLAANSPSQTALLLAPRHCRIRLASHDDITALLELEKACWAPGLQAEESTLIDRLERFPDGQHVLEAEGRVVGAIYSQRVAAAEFDGRTASEAHLLSDPSGRIIQLLALNVGHGVQDRGFGDLLLEFALQRASAHPDIDEVVGITRCKDYGKRSDLSLCDYVKLRNERGRRVDPVLRLHESHGGKIIGLIQGYRPADTVNNGAGVLVRYDLRNRKQSDDIVQDTAVRERPRDASAFVRQAIADIVAIPETSILPSMPLFELGLDSNNLLDLNERLSAAFGIALEPAFFFEHNTCARIAAFLDGHSSGARPHQSSSANGRDADDIRPDDIAIVGMACRLPGGIDSPQAFWRLLIEGRDAITSLPPGRWQWPDGFDLAAHPGIDCGGFLDDIAGFDAAFFRISPREAAGMDPQQRLLLETTWNSFEDAGWRPSELAGSETGVFVGASGSDYHLRLCEKPLADVEGHFALGVSMAVLANRLSYFYDFNGPSLHIDTACSSSLVALHEAVTALRNGSCSRALVAGVNVLCHPAGSIAFHHAGMLSQDGRCKTFDADADGYVRGEGVVVLLLRPLSAAIADGDRIQAVIKGTATNHGGLAAGLTVPNPAKQADLVRRALESADVSPETISYVEAHGTGTALGDPVEVRGLKQALGSQRTHSPCFLGSVKTNVGHLEAAAGLAGVLKTVLALQEQTIPASLNFTSLNPHFSLSDGPFRVAASATPWPRSVNGDRRRAGVSSFGSGGANAHAILEEAPQPPSRPQQIADSPIAIPLSARTPEALREHVLNLIAALETQSDALRLEDVAYTLQVGRDTFDCRLAVTATTIDELVSKLRAFLEGSTSGIALGGEGHATANGAANPAATQADLAQHWAQGGEVDWAKKWIARAPRRVALPTYPFDRKRYWLDERAEPSVEHRPTAGPDDIRSKLRQFLAEVLDVPALEIADDADLRSIGLDSIGSIKLQQRIKKDLGVELTNIDILDNESFAMLAEHVESVAGPDPAKEKRPEPIPSPETLRTLSEGQKGLWSLQMAMPEMAAYNLPFALRVNSAVDPQRLESAVRTALGRHSVVGEGIIETPQGPRRTPAVPLPPLEREDISGLDEGALLAHLRTLVRRPFALAKSAPIRVHLLEREKGTIILFVIHHIAFDAGSIRPFFQTLLDSYFKGTSASSDEPPAGDYREFVTWEADFLAGPSGARAREHFRDRLAGAPTAIDFSLDPPATQRRYTGHTDELRTSREDAKAIESFCRAERVTPASLLLTCFLAALAHRTGENDIVIGVTAAGRLRAEFESVVGYFVNIVPVRLQFDPTESWANAARSVQRVLTGDLDHAAYPFGTLVRELQVSRVPDRTPVFQVAFNHQSYFSPDAYRALESRYASHVDIRFLDELRQEPDNELELETAIADGQVVLRIKHDLSRIDHNTAAQLNASILSLLQQATHAPRQSIEASVKCVADPERALPAERHALDPSPARALAVHDRIAQQAARTPDAVAYRFNDQTLTYAELERRADQLARELAARGVAANDRVGVNLHRSLDLPVALLGVMKAGAAYVPIEPDHPAQRLAQIVDDSAPKLIVTQDSLVDKLAAFCGPDLVRLSMDHVRSETASRETTRPLVGCRPGNVAYVIYTSGTTGKPKGVVIGHAAFSSALSALVQTPGLTSGDNLFAVTTFGFDIAGFELFGPLLVGATCTICASDVVADAGRLRSSIEAAQPTVLQAVPSLWKMLFDAGWRAPADMRLICGGEALPDRLRQHFESSGAEVWNVYGPTEATIWATAQRVASGEPLGVGKPLSNTRVYIVDEAMQPVPAGVTGELCIAGAGLADGYFNKPELTRQRFMPNPFEGEGKLYRTGDRARWLPDGSVDVLGRADGQVKLRGHRIELGDIEKNLAAHPQVRDAVVILENVDEHARLAAFYVAGGPEHPDPATLRAHLKDHLPQYMIPARFARIDQLPLTANGKIDRLALAHRRKVETPTAQNLSSSEEVAGLEATVAAIWRNILSIPAVGRHDAFFDVGGDSVLAVSVARQVAEATGRPFDVTALFRHPTVAAIAEHLASAQQPPAQRIQSFTDEAATPAEADFRGYAIVGISCHFPDADNVDRFWENLLAGHDAVHKPDSDDLRRRGASDAVICDPNFVAARATIEGKQNFDAAFFRVAPRDAEHMHPQARLLLMHAWAAIEDAGYGVSRVADTAVFMSASNTSYGTSRPAPDEADTARVLSEFGVYQQWLLNQPGTLPTFISNRLGLTGPSCFVHSNCSSSLVGLDLACQTLERGDARQALVGAASLLSQWSDGYVHQEGLNFASDGRVKAFDASADGMIGGEGVAVVMLKRHADAVADGDHIYAVVRAVAVNNDGAAKAGYYAPSIQGQTAAIESALASAGVDRQAIRFVEAHGTGTALGDPIEIAALKDAFASSGAERASCGLGSVKSNIGHVDVAAGLAGLIKTALALEHGVVPPTLHVENINPRMDIEESPFFVATKVQTLPQNGVVCAALSSFGIGGTNAHAILERAQSAEREQPQNVAPHVFPLSGKDVPALQRQVKNFLAALQHLQDLHLPDVAFTLQVGREAFDKRLSVVATNKTELTGRLQRWLAGEAAIEGVDDGTATASETIAFSTDADFTALVQRWLDTRKLEPLATLWAQGYALDWSALARLHSPRRLRLPTYAFEQTPFWSSPSGNSSAERADRLHPLLHENISTMSRFGFKARLTGQEDFIKDHVVNGVCVLPAVVHLEMARAAATQIFEVADTSVRLTEVVWLRPLVVKPGTEVVIDLDVESDEHITWSIRGASSSHSDADNDQLFSRGRVHLVDHDTDAPAAVIDVAALRDACARSVDGDACYARFAALGFAYGTTYRTLSRLSVGGSGHDVFAIADVQASAPQEDDAFVLRSGIVDAMLQSRLGFDRSVMGVGDEQPASMPFAIENLRIYDRTPERGVVWTRAAAGTSDDSGLPALDIDITDDAGNVCVAVRGFVSRHVPIETATTLLARPVWLDGPLQPRPEATERRLVVLCGSNTRTPAVGKAIAESTPDLRQLIIDTDCEAIGAFYRATAAELFIELKSLAAASSDRDVLVQLAICGDEHETVIEGLSGLLESAHLEHPHIIGQTVRFEGDVSPDDIATMLTADASAFCDQLRHGSNGSARYLGWEEFEGTSDDGSTPWRKGAVYLITGGFGGLGLIFAEDIARRAPGATVVLTGRSAADAAARERIALIEGLGARVVQRSLDVTDASAVSRLVAQISEEFGPISGVLHAAGVLRDGLMAHKAVRDFETVLPPKVDGTLNLDAATANQPLELFVLFASTSGVFGGVGQTDYAAANGFLDAFTEHRNRLKANGSRSGRTITIDWPLWADGGMRVDASAERLRRARGLSPLTTTAGLAVFDAAVASDVDRILVMSGDPTRLRADFLAERDTAPAPLAVPEPEAAPAPVNKPQLPSNRLREQAAEFIKRYVSKVMKLPASRIGATADLDQYGIDSVIAIELVVTLEVEFGPLPKTLLFERRSVNDLAEYFLESHNDKMLGLLGPAGKSVSGALPQRAINNASATSRPSRPPRAQSSRVRTNHPPGKRDDVAIIGIAGRYPKARSVSEFWDNLRGGKDCITEVPADRWNHARYFDPDKSRRDTTYGKWGGFIDGMDECDPLFFSIAPREMESIDPQERLFLQCAYEAMEDAGYTRDSLASDPGTSANVGVYVGVMYSEYQLYGAQAQTRGSGLTLTGSPASIANRVSYFCNFTGPSVAVDTMCSSSLTAIHLACRDLAEDCDYAIAGGVNISVHPNKYLFLGQHGFISSEGRCAAFGQGGDGYVPGEGVGAVLLKSLSRAVADGDRIYGIIRGTSINHGGKTNGYTVPNPNAQGRVIERALRSAGVDARQVSYIEAHGTGTSLGDPIEIAGLSRAFSAFTDDRGFCAIGSAKSNIGHCESAAGIAGLTKVLLQMQHGELVPSLHAETLNPHIDFESTPFVVQRELAPWRHPTSPDGTRELPRIAGVSSFGAGGSNAHIVIEEYVAPAVPQPIAEAGPQILVLSARTDDRLRARAKDLVAAMASQDLETASLADIAYTLQVGREALEVRLALTAATLEEARARIEAWLSGEDDLPDLWRGGKREREGALSLLGEDDLSGVVERWLTHGQFDRIAEAWTKGVVIDWPSLHANAKRKRVQLPTYPFERTRSWPAEAHDQPVATGPSASHPLVHENVSDFYQHRFRSRFDGGEAFFADHLVKGGPVLPAAAHLEMARFAVATLTGNTAGVRLHGITLARPIQPMATGVDVTIDVTIQDDGNFSWQLRGASDEHDEERLYSQGRAELIEPTAAQIDLDELNTRNWRDLPVAKVYERFAAGGLSYGPKFQGLSRLAVLDGDEPGDRVVLAKVTQNRSGLVLEPGVLDCAFQSTLALDPAIEQSASDAPDLPVPFAIDEVTVYKALPDRVLVLARYAEDSTHDGPFIKIDVDIVDEQGIVCVAFRGLSGKSSSHKAVATQDRSTTDAVLLAPCWEPTRPEVLTAWPAPSDNVVILGGGSSVDAFRSAFPNALFLSVDDTTSEDTLTERLGAAGTITHLIWVVPPGDPSAALDQRLILMQETGVMCGFRIVKALLQLGYGSRTFAWTTVTEQTIATHPSESIDPAHASIHGLLGSTAKEYATSWKLRIVDVPAGAPPPIEQILCLPHARNGDPLAWRGNEWLARALLPSRLAAPADAAPPQGGVYVVLGGAGGIGEAWTRHVAQHQGAKVVWLGRRAEDDAIRSKIERIAEVGPAPIYLQADALDRKALEAARERIVSSLGPITGLVHAALVLNDAPLARMDEELFRASLAAKVNSSVNMAAAFASDSLQTITFFSSTMSFAMAAGQSNYAAGCCFTDAFAHALRLGSGISAKVMNWGWWGSVGVVATDFYRQRMGRLGFASVEPEEGMAALQALLDGPLHQVAFLKTTRPLTQERDAVLDETLHALKTEAPSIVASLRGL